jgi:Ca-activated chloride channel family protein
MTRLSAAVLAMAALGWHVPVFSQDTQAPQAPPITFRSAVDVVQISAVVRDRAGRLVTNLSAADFEVLDSGLRRTITELRRDLAGLSVALLFDVSGSMEGRMAHAREAAQAVLGRLEESRDEFAVFTFDTRLREMAPFRTDARQLPEALFAARPFGQTSLNDAIAQTAERVGARDGRRRAVVVFTDGDDNASRLGAREVQSAASTIDVPVYVFGLVSPFESPATDVPLSRGGDRAAERRELTGVLTDLAMGTGGQVFAAGTAVQRAAAARYIIDELRNQYLIAFESNGWPGWHPLVIRTVDRDLAVRTRTGYYAGQSRPNRG